MSEKGVVIPIAFLILSVSLIFLAYIFYNVFYGTKYEKFVLETKIVDVARNLLESFKSYLKIALSYSSHQSLREHACVGGTIEVKENKVIVAPWICNGPNPVPYELSKECLGTYTRYYLNIYREKFNTTLPLNLISSDFEECAYGVDNPFGGKYDEGNFLVNCSKTKASVTGKDISLYEDISTYNSITKNRYWYLFRIFTEWAKNDIFSPCICSKIGCACSSTSGAEMCSSNCLNEVEECAERALRDLQKRFDEYVECKKERICCAQGIGPACLPSSPCLSWNNEICSTQCEHECYPPPQNICPLNTISQTAHSTQSPIFTSYLDPSSKIRFSSENSNLGCNCIYWYEARLAAAYKFECKDYKYFVPSSKGPIPLTFSVSAYAFWRDQDACRGIKSCECPATATSCQDCKPVNCCTGCFS